MLLENINEEELAKHYNATIQTLQKIPAFKSIEQIEYTGSDYDNVLAEQGAKENSSKLPRWSTLSPEDRMAVLETLKEYAYASSDDDFQSEKNMCVDAIMCAMKVPGYKAEDFYKASTDHTFSEPSRILYKLAQGVGHLSGESNTYHYKRKKDFNMAGLFDDTYALIKEELKKQEEKSEEKPELEGKPEPEGKPESEGKPEPKDPKEPDTKDPKEPEPDTKDPKEPESKDPKEPKVNDSSFGEWIESIDLSDTSKDTSKEPEDKSENKSTVAAALQKSGEKVTEQEQDVSRSLGKQSERM